MDYSKVRAKFKNGDWVFGLGDHIGCSVVFNIESDMPQPFSYLNTDDETKFRLATHDEIRAATERDNVKGNPSGFYLLSCDKDPNTSLVLLYDCSDFNGVRHLAFGHWDGSALIPVCDLSEEYTLTPVRIFAEGDGDLLRREVVQRCLFSNCH